MKKWLMMVIPAILSMNLAIPSFGDTTSDGVQNVSIYSESYNLIVGNTTNLHLYATGGASNANGSFQIQTSIGSLNGQGSTITVSAADLSKPVVFTSTQSGQALVNVMENGVIVGKTTVTFLPDQVANVNVQVTPSTATAGIPVTFTITGTDKYGNKVPAGTSGSIFDLETTEGSFSLNGGSSGSSGINVGLQDGIAKVMLNDTQVGTANVTVTDTGVTSNQVKINGQPGNSISIPVNFGYIQSVTVSSPIVYQDTVQASQDELSSLQELSQVGVVHGYTDGTFHPNDPMKRSEFATMVAQYMGMSSVAKVLNGSGTPFADVPADAWYDGAVAACAQFGYVHGDGTNFYPNQNVTNAEVAQILLNNLGIATPPNSFPEGAMTAAEQNHLFDHVPGVLLPGEDATRGNIAIMVRNALHTVASGSQGQGTASILPLSTTKTLETETLGYTWHGDSTQSATVNSVPSNGSNVGNEIGSTDGTLHLANNVVIAGSSTIDDLLNKKIQYLTNPIGLVTFIEVVQ